MPDVGREQDPCSGKDNMFTHLNEIIRSTVNRKERVYQFRQA